MKFPRFKVISPRGLETFWLGPDKTWPDRSGSWLIRKRGCSSLWWLTHREKARIEDTECHPCGLRTLTQAGHDKGAGFTVSHPYFSICLSREKLPGGFRDMSKTCLILRQEAGPQEKRKA